MTQAVQHLWLTRKQPRMSTNKWRWNLLLLYLHNVVNWTFIKDYHRSVVLNVLNGKKKLADDDQGNDEDEMSQQLRLTKQA